MSYTLLRGVRVLEVSLLATSIAGQLLADLGADVLKIEAPGRGDYVRELGSDFLDGVSLLHLRWNRGKQSLVLDLRSEQGREAFRALAARADVVVDGLRSGTLDAWSLGYDDLAPGHASLVYCSMSGTGSFGPYRRLATHGLLYDAFAGLAPPDRSRPDGVPRVPEIHPVGMEEAGLYAALVVVAAVLRARDAGEGAFVEVAEMDAACAAAADAVERRLNPVERRERASVGESVRYSYYDTADGKVVCFQASEAKFWAAFCRAVGRADLLERYPSEPVGDHARGNEALRRELAAIFATRTQAAWVACFLEHGVPGGPVHTAASLVEDGHFLARELLYEPAARAGPGTGHRLVGSPMKVRGERFSAGRAPALGDHDPEVLARVWGAGAHGGATEAAAAAEGAAAEAAAEDRHR